MQRFTIALMRSKHTCCLVHSCERLGRAGEAAAISPRDIETTSNHRRSSKMQASRTSYNQLPALVLVTALDHVLTAGYVGYHGTATSRTRFGFNIERLNHFHCQTFRPCTAGWTSTVLY
jgi:hypothetical protein